MSLAHILSLYCIVPVIMLSNLKAQQIANLSSDPDSGRLVFTLTAPVSLNVSSDHRGGSIGFILRDVYSEAKGSATEVFTNALTGQGVENTLRAYIPKVNHTCTPNYGTWGTRPNTSGDITARDFFGDLTLNGVDLVAGDQVILLPGKVTLQANAATLLPEFLNDATEFQFIVPGVGANLSNRAGIGAITVPIPETKIVDVTVTESTVVVSWTGPGLFERSRDLGQTDPWLRDNSLSALSPPRTLFRSQIGRSDFFFRMATPWNEFLSP